MRTLDRWSKIMVGAIACGIALTVARVGYLKLSPPVQLGDKSGAATRIRNEPRFRGAICDRNGRILAIDSPCWKLAVDPGHFSEHGHERMRRLLLEDPVALEETSGSGVDPRLAGIAGPFEMAREHLRGRRLRDLAERLEDLIGLPATETTAKLLQASSRRRYLVLDRILEGWQVDALSAWFDGYSPGWFGLMLEKRTERRYYGPESLQMIVGKCRDDGMGGSGLEQGRQSNLRSVEGTLQTRQTASGAVISIPIGTYEPGNHGSDFALTIDSQIQHLTEMRLREQLAKYNAGGGRCVVVDPRNGEILAMVDILNRRPETDEWREAILDDPQRRIDPKLARNRNIVDAFEPGSTFKPFIWAGAVMAGVGTTDPVRLDRINVHEIRVPGRRTTVKDAGNNPYKGPIQDIETILVRSLNTGMVEMVQDLSNRQVREIMTRFGFGSRTNCGIGGSAEHPGQMTSIENWSFANTTVSVSFGHEVTVTTLQMARAFSAFCNDGRMPQLRIGQPADGPEGPRDLDPAGMLMQRAISREAANRTRQALRKVVLEGTLSRHARSDRYSMFGKSGTADLPNPAGGYFKKRHTSNVIAGAPFEQPRVVVYCVIDDPDRAIGYYGGLVAGPVVKDVVDGSLELLGVEPDLPGAPGSDHKVMVD